jgi:hypothetical protein
MLEQLTLQISQADVLNTLFNLLLGLLLSLLLAGHFIRYGRTLSNRKAFAWIFPSITLTTILVISIVKSSLTLSLGLVGALSIVRFRTPIKEPEELAYLFLSIAMGIGLGANQRMTTVAAGILILGLLSIRAAAVRNRENSLFFLTIEVPEDDEGEPMPSRINSLLVENGFKIDVRRVDSRNGILVSTYFFDCRDKQQLTQLIETIKQKIPGASVSLVRQDNLIGI